MLAGVLFTNFLISQKKAAHAILTENQVKWLEIQKSILNQKPFIFYPPKNIYKKIYDIFNQTNYLKILKFLFIVNVLILAVYNDKLKKSNNKFQEFYQNIFIFLGIFYSIEAILKIFCIGIKQYISIHKIEFLIFIFYNVDIISNLVIKEKISIRLNENIEKLFIFVKFFRILIFFRLFKNFKFIENILKCLSFVFPLLMNILGLFIVNLFIFSILGCFLFGSVKKGKIIDDFTNFKNFLYGMLTLFKCATGDDWSKIMFDTMISTNCIQYHNTCGSSTKILIIYILLCENLIFNNKINFILKYFFLLIIL